MDFLYDGYALMVGAWQAGYYFEDFKDYIQTFIESRLGI